MIFLKALCIGAISTSSTMWPVSSLSNCPTSIQCLSKEKWPVTFYTLSCARSKTQALSMESLAPSMVSSATTALSASHSARSLRLAMTPASATRWLAASISFPSLSRRISSSTFALSSSVSPTFYPRSCSRSSTGSCPRRRALRCPTWRVSVRHQFLCMASTPSKSVSGMKNSKSSARSTATPT